MGHLEDIYARDKATLVEARDLAWDVLRVRHLGDLLQDQIEYIDAHTPFEWAIEKAKGAVRGGLSGGGVEGRPLEDGYITAIAGRTVVTLCGLPDDLQPQREKRSEA